MKVGQKFYMSHKYSPQPRLFQYIGQDPDWHDSCNHMMLEVSTGIINHTELEWLNQRTIREIND